MSVYHWCEMSELQWSVLAVNLWCTEIRFGCGRSVLTTASCIRLRYQFIATKD